MAIVDWVALILFVFGAGGYYILSRRINLRWWWALAIRLVLLLVLISAFSEGIGASSQAESKPEIFILDISDSIQAEEVIDARVFATAWKNAKPNREVLIFGVGLDYMLSEEIPQESTSGSNLLDALHAAESNLGGEPGRILVATDGLVSDLSAIQKVLAELTSKEIEFVFLPLQTKNYPNDLFVGELLGAKTVWEETRFSLRVPVFAPQNIIEQPAEIHVTVNGEEYIESEEIILGGGQSQLSIPFQAGGSGVMAITVEVNLPGDEFLGNNTAYTSIRVLPVPRVLLVTDSENGVRNFVSGLVSQGYQVEITNPELFPSSVEDLDGYHAFILHDILSQDLDLEQMKNLQIQVVEFGKGLIFLGGRNSYTLGGYQNTVLGQLMPVTLAPPDRVQRVPITFLLVLDRSGSMAGDRDSDIAPIELTREGAMRAIETLRSDDYLGVMTFSGVFDWAVDIRPVGDGLTLREAQDKVSRIEAFGGTFMFNALEEAVSQLVGTNTTEHPHILLMSDGVSADGSRDEFLRLVQEARQNGITISTIALGSESDPEMLAAIAENGGGRYYLVLDPNELPEVMISETRAVQAENVQEGLTNILLNIENHPMLADIKLNTLPRLTAYNALQRKPDLAIEDVLISGNFNDPLLSVWQVGLGHVAVWMADIGENWVPEMRDWEGQGQFWSQVIRYTLPSPNLGRSYVSVNESETALYLGLSVNYDELLGETNVYPELILPDGEQNSIVYNLPQTGSQTYGLEIEKPEPGAYTGIIRYTSGGDQTIIPVPFAINYPAEWQFGGQDEADKAMNRLVQISAGTLSSMDDEIDQTFAEAELARFGIFEILLALLVVSWPLEIAIRRWKMPWRKP